MKILVVSNSEWDDGNSFGNTFSNILSFEKPQHIANIYCRNGVPSTTTCGRFFSMGERDVINMIIHHVDFKEVYNNINNHEQRVIGGTNPLKDFIRTHRWIVFFWAREIIWSVCPWKKSKSLKAFVEDFGPDILFLPTYGYSYINKLALHLSEAYHLPIVSYISDDEYSLNQRSWSPLYWINRLYQRVWIKKGFDKSSILYTISEIQREYYSKIVKCPCKVLTKGLVFEGDEPPCQIVNQPIKIFYAGNIGSGRWRSLKIIAEAVRKINQAHDYFSFDIYTASPITEDIRKAFIGKGVNLRGYAQASKIQWLIRQADILVHAESFRVKDKMAVRQSFSTKIVDYLHSGKCVMAIGPADVASVDFLIKRNAALVIDKPEKAYSLLESLLEKKEIINCFAKKAWLVGKESCDIRKMHAMLKKDFEKLIDKQYDI